MVAVWDGAATAGPVLARFEDPRAPGLGERVLLAEAPAALASDRDAYEAHRIALGAPAGGIDFAYGDTFPHDANLDLLRGVDFEKGCYVGQEVVSRVQHRGTARRRIVRVSLDDAAAPGTPVMAGEVVVGTLGSVAGRDALASLRLDKIEDAKVAGVPLEAGGVRMAVLEA